MRMFNSRLSSMACACYALRSCTYLSCLVIFSMTFAFLSSSFFRFLYIFFSRSDFFVASSSRMIFHASSYSLWYSSTRSKAFCSFSYSDSTKFSLPLSMLYLTFWLCCNRSSLAMRVSYYCFSSSSCRTAFFCIYFKACILYSLHVRSCFCSCTSLALIATSSILLLESLANFIF